MNKFKFILKKTINDERLMKIVEHCLINKVFFYSPS